MDQSKMSLREMKFVTNIANQLIFELENIEIVDDKVVLVTKALEVTVGLKKNKRKGKK